MGSRSESLAAILSPPVVGGILAAGSSTTVAAIDLHVDIADPYQAGVTVRRYGRNRFITVQAETADVYIAFSAANNTAIDPTAATGVFTSTAHCARIPAGSERNFEVGGSLATRYLLHRTATGTATVRVWASSPKTSEEN